MEQGQFFSTIEWNLKQLVHEHAPLPVYNLPGRGLKVVRALQGVFRASRLAEVSRTNPPAPRNVKVWDLAGMRLFGGRPLKFRVFACYAENPTAEECDKVKYELWKWYQFNGLNTGHDRPYSGAMVIGCGGPLADGVRPDGKRLPERVPYETWTCSGSSGPIVREFGEGVGQIMARAMTPETFVECKARVKKAVDFELDYDGGGHVTAELIADKTGVHMNVVSHIFREMMGESDYVVSKLPRTDGLGRPRTKDQRLYIKRGHVSTTRRLLARKMGKWYVQDGFLPACTLTVTGAFFWLFEKFAFKYLSMPVFAHRWLTVSVGVVLVVVLAGMGMSLFRRR